MLLSFVDQSLVRRHLGAQAVNAAEMVALLEHRAIPAGTPVFLDDVTMLPIEPLCSWFRHLAYDDKDAKTMREYAYIVRRFVDFLQSRLSRAIYLRKYYAVPGEQVATGCRLLRRLCLWSANRC